jgi:hypothetical protein
MSAMSRKQTFALGAADPCSVRESPRFAPVAAAFLVGWRIDGLDFHQGKSDSLDLGGEWNLAFRFDSDLLLHAVFRSFSIT